jgi:hypothetical protein
MKSVDWQCYPRFSYWSATQDVGVMVSITISFTPTYQQVRQTCDTIVAQVANPIFGKLCFCIINFSQKK